MDRVQNSPINGENLIEAVMDNDLPKVTRILTNNPEIINYVSELGVTALHYAAAGNFNEMTKLLLRNSANINHQDNQGFTALHDALENQPLTVACTLIRHGANMDIPDNRDLTARQKIANTISSRADLELLRSAEDELRRGVINAPRSSSFGDRVENPSSFSISR